MFEKEESVSLDRFSKTYQELDGVVFCHAGDPHMDKLRLVKAWAQELSKKVPFHSYKAGFWVTKPLPGRVLYIFDHSCRTFSTAFDLKPFYDSLGCGCLWLYRDGIDLSAQALEQSSIDLIQDHIALDILGARLVRMRKFILNRYRLWLLQEAVEHSSTSLSISDPTLHDNPVIYANPAFCHLTGYSVDEIVGINCRFLQGEDTTQEAVDEIRNAMEEKRPGKVLLRNYRKDGSLFWNDLNLTPILDLGGRPAFYVGIQKDVTGEVQARNKLIQSEARFRLLADSLPEMIWASDQHGDWTFASRKLRQLLSLGDLRNARTIFAKLIRDEASQWELTKNLGGVEAFELTLSLLLPAGVRTYAINAAPWLDDEQNFLGFLLCASDVTDFSAQTRILSERNNVLTAQLLIKKKIMQNEPAELVCKEALEVIENLTAGRAFFVLPDSPPRGHGLPESGTLLFLELLENEILQLPEISQLLVSGQPLSSGAEKILHDWFGDDEFCIYTWKFSNGRQAALGVSRDSGKGPWNRSQLDLVRNFGRTISVMVDVQIKKPEITSDGESILQRLPLPAAILSAKLEVIFENTVFRQLKKNHGPGVVKRLLSGLESEHSNSGVNTKSLLRKVGEKTWFRLHLIPMASKGNTTLLIQDVSIQMEMESKVKHYKYIENLGRMRLEVQSEWSNTVGVFKLALNGLKDEVPDVENNRNYHVLESTGISIEGLSRQIQVYTGEGSLSLQNKDINAWINAKRELLLQIWGLEINFDFVLRHGKCVVAMDDPCLTQALQSLLVLLFPQVDTDKPCFSILTASNPIAQTAELILVAGPALPDQLPVPFKTPVESDCSTLEIAEAILKAHGGSLEEFKISGEYHAFRLCLPIVEESKSNGFVGDSNSFRFDSSTEVLVVEDNYPMLEVIRASLEKVGCRVQTASHAIEAHSLWNKFQKQIQFCIVDVNLPGGESGVDLVKSMRKQTPRLPVLFTSGYDRIELTNRFGLGEDELVLNKPFSHLSLMDRLKEIIKLV